MIETCQTKDIIDVIDLGITKYNEAYHLQKGLVQRRKIGIIPDTILLTEHHPVFTIGRMGSRKNLLIDEDTLQALGIDLFEVDRGGDITFHGLGQLVLYPIVDLKPRGRDLRRYIKRLEDVMISFLLRYNIKGIRIPGATGAWVNDDTKIGSIGIGVSKWITYHGLSININTPLYYFDMIRPCGLSSCKMTSISSILKKTIAIDEAKENLVISFQKIFADR